jgi:hypothetical protein
MSNYNASLLSVNSFIVNNFLLSENDYVWQVERLKLIQYVINHTFVSGQEKVKNFAKKS